MDKPVVSWAFDVVVALAGAVVGLVALTDLVAGGNLELRWAVALVVGAPVAALMSRFPLVLNRGSGAIEVGFESAVLVFLACYGDGSRALAVWTFGQVLAQIISTKRTDIRCFNVGLGVLSGFVALEVMAGVGGLGSSRPQELAAIALGCAAYFVVDYLVSAVSIALELRTGLFRALLQPSALAALGVFVAIDSLGYLSALVVRGLPWWAAFLLAVPVATILVAVRALTRGAEHARRLSALFDAAAEAQAVHSPEELELVLRVSVRAAVGRHDADLRDEPPGEGEIGSRVRAGQRSRWLVAPVRGAARSSVAADCRALEALATVGDEAFSRLALTEELALLARHDALTGLPNRAVFLDRVTESVLRAGPQTPDLAVLFLDLDGFKGVNDRFGHAEGDELLRIVAARLVDAVRGVDSVARLGGDEFAVLFEGVHGVSGLEVLCDRLLATLRAEIRVLQHGLVLGASIGVAVARPGDDAAGLLRNADMAMYRAKELGKNRYFIYQPWLREEKVRRLELVESLRAGIGSELVVHYQPVVDLVSGQIDGVEALVRWARPHGLVGPDEFIALAEESGLIGELGERVLTRLVEDVPSMVAAAGRPLSFACNMSALQLRDPGFQSQVGRAVAALGPSTLVLEMTETVVVAANEETGRALHALRDLGASLAIDDFGVGFSSIGYLQHLPVDSLKIDRSFVGDIDTSERAAALVEAILVMGAALDLEVVAEGIERPGQLDRLKQAGCTTGQGYLFGRPQPLPAVLRLLHDGLPARALARVPGSGR